MSGSPVIAGLNPRMSTVSIDTPAVPLQVGERVRQYGYGGEVAQWMESGTVVGFNRSGFPKVLVDDPPGRISIRKTVTDRWGCFRVVDADGHFRFTSASVEGR